MPDPMNIADTAPQAREEAFRAELAALGSPEMPPAVLELGTLRWEADRPTHHKAWRPEAAWVMSDLTPGVDVEVVSDAHLLEEFEPGYFDAYVAVSLYEHLQRPWLAALAAHRVLRSGGWLYVATHQTFPLHGYPHDFFRFSSAALKTLFQDAGFLVHDVGYSYPCKIVPPPEVTRWNPAADAWLNVDIVAQKPYG